MQINRRLLNQLGRTYVLSPAAAAKSDEEDTGPLLNLVLNLFSFIGGLLLLVTIYYAKTGLMIWKMVFTGELARSLKDEMRRDVDQVRYLVCRPIMSGPHGFSLVLARKDGADDPEAMDELADKLFALYREGEQGPQDAAVVALLRDDGFRPGRQRVLPEPYGENGTYFVFDRQLNPADIGSGLTVVAAKQTEVEQRMAILLNIPWDAVAPAFSG